MCLKLYKTDKSDRDGCEFNALTHLAARHHALRAAVEVLGRPRHLPLGPFSDLPRVDSATNYLHRITAVWPDQLNQYPDEPQTANLITLLDTWREAARWLGIRAIV